MSETEEEKQARIKLNLDRSWNRYIHDESLRLQKTLMLVASRNIDVTHVDWRVVNETLRGIEDAADRLGGKDG